MSGELGSGVHRNFWPRVEMSQLTPKGLLALSPTLRAPHSGPRVWGGCARRPAGISPRVRTSGLRAGAWTLRCIWLSPRLAVTAGSLAFKRDAAAHEGAGPFPVPSSGPMLADVGNLSLIHI